MPAPFRLGIVGAGLIAHDHALSLARMSTVKELLFHDSDAARAAKLADEFRGRVVGKLSDLVDAADLVWICTPPFVRLEPVRAACRAGKPIFCEKPLAVSAAEAKQLRRLVASAGVPFFMGQSGRYSYFFQKIKELVQAGTVGAVTRVWSTRLGRLDPAKAPAWRLDDQLSGGVVTELGVHELDFVRWIGGDWRRLAAVASNRTLIPGKYQDTVTAVGELASGAIANVQLCWASPRYLWQRGVEGTTGSLFFDDCRVREVHLLRPGKDVEIHHTGDWKDHATGENLSLKEQAIAVLSALAAGAPPPVTLEDGYQAVLAAAAMRRAAATGRTVAVR